LKKLIYEKNWLNRLEYLKKYLVWFRFYKSEIEKPQSNWIDLVKNKPNQTGKKIEQKKTKPNRNQAHQKIK